MLRIHFTDRDLARVEVASGLDPLWETLLAAQQLSPAARGGHAAFGDWRQRARAELADARLGGALRAVQTLAPARAGYFPDFLTPGASAAGLAGGLDALRGTPRGILADEMARTFRRRTVHPWCRDIARGDRAALAELADGVALLYRTVIAPGWSAAEAMVESDRAVRARALRDGGVHGLLASLAPYARWEPPTLSVLYPQRRELPLCGRGLRLVPSRFCCRTPIALADPTLPQVLVYPVGGAAPAGHGHGGHGHGGHGHGGHRARALATLLGRTRARVLLALASSATTGELAVRLAVSAATASGHVSALREAGLVMSHRRGGSVVHTLAPLGTALLRGGE
jgi:DNA-binding transcriptional ArsR family regulator